MRNAAKARVWILVLMGIAPISMAQTVNVLIQGNQNANPQSSPPVDISQDNQFARDFRGSVVYKGTYAGTVTRSLRNGSQSEPMEGAFTLTITVDGAAVKAQLASTGRLRFGALSGVVSNGVCKLYDSDLLEGRCDLKHFNANTSYNHGNKTGQFHLEGMAVSVEDFVIRDAKRAAEAEEARKRAEAARAEELVARAKMRATLTSGSIAKYKPLLDSAVSADAGHWFSNRYANGSIDLVSVQNDKESGAVFLKAYFNYVGGHEGWVGAIVMKGRIQCLQFWDDSSGCRGIGSGANAKIAQGFLARMLSGVGEAPGDADRCDSTCQSDQVTRRSQRDSARQQAEADARMRAATEAQERALANRDAIGR